MKKMFLFVLLLFSVLCAAINDYWYVVQGGAGATNGDDWDNAFAYADFVTFMNGSLTAGDVIFIKDGAYTAAASVASAGTPGTAVNPIIIVGVKSSCTNLGANIDSADIAIDSTDRPEIDLGTIYRIQVGAYTNIAHINVYGSNSYLFNLTSDSYVYNCNINHNDGSPSAEYAVYVGTSCALIHCTIQSANCNGATVGNYGQVSYCKFISFTGSANGIAIGNTGTGIIVTNNLIKNSVRGFYSTADNRPYVDGNTFFKCDTAMFFTTDYTRPIINNAIDSCGVGIHWDTQTDVNLVFHNAIHATTTATENVATSTIFRDFWMVTGDPLFAYPFDGTIQTGSALIDAGLQ